MKQGKGKITVKRSGIARNGTGGYESGWVYIPSKVFKDASFPFGENDEVFIEIKEDSVIITKREEIFNIIEDYGINNATLPKILEKKSEEIGDNTFLIFKDKEFSFKETSINSNKIAHGLKEFIKPRGRNRTKVALLFPNCPEYIFCWFGIIKAGGIFVPLNTSLDEKSLKFIINHSDSEILILDYQFFNVFLEIHKDLPKLKKIIVRNVPENFNLNEEFISFEEINTSNKSNLEISIRPHYDMQILYTIGTTGLPKGVIYQNYLILTGLILGKELQKIGFSSNDRIYCPLPLYHGFTQILSILPSLFMGTPIILCERFNLNNIWEEIKKTKATLLTYVGGMIQYIMNQPYKETDQNHGLKWAFGQGTPIELWEAFENRFEITIFEGWALTESIGITINKKGSKGGKLGSCGTPIASFRLKIVDPYGNKLPPGKENIGEILSKNVLPITFSNYHKEIEEQKLKIDSEGYYHTGDIGYLDEEGYLFYCGRKQDLITKAGKNILAGDIEKIALTHPSIVDAAVIGIKDEGSGEVELKIVTILRKKQKLEPLDFYRYLTKKMAPYMVPRFFEFVEKMPKTRTGIIQKYKLIRDWDEGISQKNTWDSQIKNIIVANKKGKEKI